MAKLEDITLDVKASVDCSFSYGELNKDIIEAINSVFCVHGIEVIDADALTSLTLELSINSIPTATITKFLKRK